MNKYLQMSQVPVPSAYLEPISTRRAASREVALQNAADSEKKRRKELVKFVSEAVQVPRLGVKLKSSSLIRIDLNKSKKNEFGLQNSSTSDDLVRGRASVGGGVSRRSTMACSGKKPVVKPKAFRLKSAETGDKCATDVAASKDTALDSSHKSSTNGGTCSEVAGVGAAQDAGTGSHDESLTTPSPVSLLLASSNRKNAKQLPLQERPRPPRPPIHSPLASRKLDKLVSHPDRHICLDNVDQACRGQNLHKSGSVQNQEVDSPSVIERSKSYCTSTLDRQPPPRPRRPPNRPVLSSRKTPPSPLPDLKAVSTRNEKDGPALRSPPIPLSPGKAKRSPTQPLQGRGQELGKPATPSPSPKPQKTPSPVTARSLAGNVNKNNTLPNLKLNKSPVGGVTLPAETGIPIEKLEKSFLSRHVPADQSSARPIPCTPTNSRTLPHTHANPSKISLHSRRPKSPSATFTRDTTSSPKVSRSPSSLGSGLRKNLCISTPVLKSTTVNMSLSMDLIPSGEVPPSDNNSEAIYEELDMELNQPGYCIHDMGTETKPALPPDRPGKGSALPNSAVVGSSCGGKASKFHSTQGPREDEETYEIIDMVSVDDMDIAMSDGEDVYVDMKPELFSSEEDQDSEYMEMNPAERAMKSARRETSPEEYSVPILGATPMPPSPQARIFSVPSFPAPIYEYADPQMVMKNNPKASTTFSSNSDSLYYASTDLHQKPSS